MAVLSRLLVGSQQRIDLADFLSIQSYVSSDFRELMRSFVGSGPVILKGFDLINAPQSIGTTSVSINVAESVLYDPTSSAGSFFSGLPEGNALSQPIVLGQELRTNAVNYIYLTLTTTGTAQDTRAFWDVDLNGGTGGEFNQTINTEAVLIAQAGVSTSGFPQGTVPVAKITLNSSAITDITDCRNLMFRLGTGGTSPDPNNRFQFPALPSIAYARSEPPSSINSAALPNPFQGGDKNIQTLKEWMDAVMTKLVELSGTTYWYESTGDLSLVKVYDDALGSSLKSKGKWQHNESTIGLVSWTEDILYRKMNDPRDIIVRAGSKQLENEQVMWIKMVRNQKINALDTAVTFINGASYVNGTTGSFQYLNKGDWIKSKGDSEYHYARVIGFWTAANASGSETPTPSAAVSVKLEYAYTGSAGTSSAVYTKGVFTTSDSEGVRVSDRDSLDIYSAGGDMYWLANRSDTIQKISSIATYDVSTANITDGDGASAKLTFSSAHGLFSGDTVYIDNAGSFTTGLYTVEKISNTEVTIKTIQTGSASNVTVRWATVTTGPRVAGTSSFEVESANHGFASGQKVSIAGASYTSGFDINGLYTINVRSNTQFQIPYSQGNYAPTVTNATATCAKVILKTDLGSVEVVQGEEININEPDTQNLIDFIGMNSLAESNPTYNVPDSENNMLYGYANYNSNSSDSLTTRASKLTAMMADRVQDREIKLSGRVTFRNVGSGTDQIITVSGDSLTVTKPGSPSQTVTWSSTYALGQNTALVIDIDRNAATSISPSVVSYSSDFLLKENRIILLYRGSTADVYSWDGTAILNSSSWTSNDAETSQNKNIIVNEQVSVNYDGTKLTFNSTVGYVYILVPGTSTYNRIDVSNFTSGITISNNESAWVRVNRRANKTFSNRQTTPTYQDSDAAGSIYVTSTGSVPTDQDVVVLYSIQSGKLVRHRSSNVERRKIYEEFFTVVSNSSIPTVVALPTDSRNGGATAYYINGSAQLEVALNGQIMKAGEDYDEYGSSGTAQSQITVNRELIAGDVIRFRLASEGGFYTIDIGTTTTLQQAYDQGRTVTIVDGSPVVINSSAGYKALQINGDLEVTGVIDPTGLALTPQAANPLGSDHGIWVDLDGNLNQARPGKTPSSINVTESITNPSSFLTGGDGIDISTSTISVDLAVDSGLEFNLGKTRVKLPSSGPLSRDSTGIKLTVDSNSMQVTSSTLGVKIDSYSPITTSPTGLSLGLSLSNPGLAVTSNALDVKLDSSRAITSGASGIGVNIDTSSSPTLQIDGSNKLGVKLDSNRAITAYSTNGIGVNLEATTPTLKIDGSNQLGIKLDSRAITTGANGIGVNLKLTNPGLAIDGVENTLDTKLNSSGAIVSGASGLSVAVDDTSIKIQSNQLVVAGVPNLLSTFSNNTGSAIALGTVVSADTTTNQIVKTDGFNVDPGIRAIGVAYATINTGSSGQVQTSGVATVATSGLTVGKPVYLSTSTAGAVTSTRPTSYGVAAIILGIAVSTNQVLLKPQLLAVNTHVYSEIYTVGVGGVSSGSYINLPNDSKDGGNGRTYLVGKGFLSLYLNGQLLDVNDDYIEVGSGTGNSIQIQQDLVEGDRLKFVIDSGQALMMAIRNM